MNQDNELDAHWQRYKTKYAAFPTTTHFVERSVKVYNFCSNKSRSEHRISQFAVCYNVIHDVNQLTKDLMIETKVDKGQTYKKEDKVKAVGKLKNITILHNVVERHNKIENVLQNHSDLRQRFHDILETVSSDQESSFLTVRQDDYFEKAKNAMQKKAKKPNQIEKRKGVDRTPAVRKEVRFFDLRKEKQEDGLKAELMFRGFTNFSSLKIGGLKNKLKELMISHKETEETNPKNSKHFKMQSDFDWSTAFTTEN